MHQLTAEMQHLEECVWDAFPTLPQGITWDNVPIRPDAQSVLFLKSDIALSSVFKTSRVFGRVAFGFNLEGDGQKNVAWLLHSIREQLKISGFQDVKITKKFEGFQSTSMTYRKMYMKVSFYGTFDIPYRFSMEWALRIPKGKK